MREAVEDAIRVLENHDCSLYYTSEPEAIDRLVERLKAALAADDAKDSSDGGQR